MDCQDMKETILSMSKRDITFDTICTRLNSWSEGTKSRPIEVNYSKKHRKFRRNDYSKDQSKIVCLYCKQQGHMKATVQKDRK